MIVESLKLANKDWRFLLLYKSDLLFCQQLSRPMGKIKCIISIVTIMAYSSIPIKGLALLTMEAIAYAFVERPNNKVGHKSPHAFL